MEIIIGNLRAVFLSHISLAPLAVRVYTPYYVYIRNKLYSHIAQNVWYKRYSSSETPRGNICQVMNLDHIQSLTNKAYTHISKKN